MGDSGNRWSIKRSPNDTKLDRRSTGSKPRPHVKPRSIPRKFKFPNTKEKQKGTPGNIGAPDCKTDNGEDARIYEMNTYANAMHMMTWQSATCKHMTWQRRRITGGHLAHQTRGVTAPPWP